MTAYRRFKPAETARGPAKVANLAKFHRHEPETLATLATLARGERQTALTRSRAEALIDEALHAGVVFRLVDPEPREIAEGRPFRIVLCYPKETPRGLIDRLHASRAELYAAYTPAPREDGP